MDQQHILTDEEMALLQELLSHASPEQALSLTEGLNAPLNHLLHHADDLVLEARFANHLIRFPMHINPDDNGLAVLHLFAPSISELGFAQPRAWRWHEDATFHYQGQHYRISNFSFNGLIVEQLPASLTKGDKVQGQMQIEGLPALPLVGTLVRQIPLAQHDKTWAINFQMEENELTLLREWLFSRHQQAFLTTYLQK